MDRCIPDCGISSVAYHCSADYGSRGDERRVNQIVEFFAVVSNSYCPMAEVSVDGMQLRELKSTRFDRLIRSATRE